VKRDDVMAFADLYDTYSAAVFRYVLRLSANRALAEDLTSETFLRVWTAPDRLRIETVRAYLYAIARNLCLQDARTRKRQSPLEPEHLDRGATPDYERQDEARRVLDAVAALPELERSALLLRVEEGLPYNEIAQILNLSPANVRIKVHRARLRLATICGLKEVRP
jgi:RNA polymerase sigma-70 factor (ECF subfamily)